MLSNPGPLGQASPEGLMERLTRRLRNQRIRDSFLLFIPPALASLYLLSHLYRAPWIPQRTLIIIAICVIGSLLALALRYRPLAPSVRSAARLVDEKAAAEDRFLTLATVEPSLYSQAFVARLRRETSGLLGRIDLKRDFPYEIKHSFYWSVIGSTIAILLFHVLLRVAESTVAQAPPRLQMSQLVETMTQRPGLEELARDLELVANKLQDPKTTVAEKEQLLQQMQKKIEEQQKNQAQKNNQDLLGEAASTVKAMEQQSANSQQKQQEQGAGNVQSNVPDGQGENQQSQGSGGETKGDLKAQKSDPMEQGKTAQANPKEQVNEKNQSTQAGQENDKNQPGKEQGRDMRGKTEGGSEEQLGKSRSEGKGRSEENPQGAPPAERFTKPGEEGKGGLKGTRYVTVQLPEEVAAEGKGESGATREGKDAKVRPKTPISNVPLPAHVPDAPSEKQNLPLEYRGIIR